MTDKDHSKISADSKSRFSDSHGQAPPPALGSATEFVKLHSAEFTLVSSAVVGVLALSFLGLAFFSYSVSSETTSSIAANKLEETLQQLNIILTVDPLLDSVRLNRARVLTSLKKNQEALKDLNIVLEHNPKNFSALKKRSVLCIGLNKFDQVIADCNTLIDMQKDQVPAWVYGNRAGAYAMLGKKEEAVEDYSRAIRMQAKDASLFLGRAWAYRSLKQLPEALEDFEWVEMLKPGSVDAIVGKSQILVIQKHYDKALASINDGIKANPKSAQLYLERGKMLWAKDKSKAALADLSKAIALDPKNNDALLENMRVNAFIHNDKEALRIANMLILNDFKTYEVYMKRADLDLDLKNYNMAALGYEAAAGLKPNEIQPLTGRAKAVSALKQYKTAISCLKSAVKIKPTDPNLFVTLGVYQKDDKQYDDAQASFNKALALKPDFFEAYLWRGQAFCEVQDWKSAKQDLDKVLRVDPKNADAVRFMAFVNRGLTNFGKLRNISTTTAVASAPTTTITDPKLKALIASGSFDDLMKEGVSRYNQRRFSDSISLLAQAVKLNSGATAARRYLAQALVQAGDPGSAIVQYESVVAQEPGNASDLSALATALFNSRRYEDAISYDNKFLELKPNDFTATCQLISAYKEAGFAKKAQEVCKEAIHAASGIAQISKYEELMNSLTPSNTPRRQDKNAPRPAAADIQG